MQTDAPNYSEQVLGFFLNPNRFRPVTDVIRLTVNTRVHLLLTAGQGKTPAGAVASLVTYYRFRWQEHFNECASFGAQAEGRIMRVFVKHAGALLDNAANFNIWHGDFHLLS